MLAYLKARFSELSTWMALIGMFTAFGVVLEPAQAQAIALFGAVLFGGGALLPDKLKK